MWDPGRTFISSGGSSFKLLSCVFVTITQIPFGLNKFE